MLVIKGALHGVVVVTSFLTLAGLCGIQQRPREGLIAFAFFAILTGSLMGLVESI